MAEFSASTSNDVNQFTCSVCLGLVNVPKVTPCQHIFCQSCIKSWLVSSSSCPFCRKELKLDQLKRPPAGFYSDRSKVLVKCTFNANGCPEEMELRELDKHEKICKFKVPKCPCTSCKRPLEDSGEPGTKKKFCSEGCLEEHVVNLGLEAFKKLDWKDLKTCLENCSDIKTEEKMYKKFVTFLIEKQERRLEKIKQKVISHIPGTDANVNLEESYAKQLSFTRRMLAIVVRKFNEEMPNYSLKMSTYRIGSRASILYHYASRFKTGFPIGINCTYTMKGY